MRGAAEGGRRSRSRGAEDGTGGRRSRSRGVEEDGKPLPPADKSEEEAVKKEGEEDEKAAVELEAAAAAPVAELKAARIEVGGIEGRCMPPDLHGGSACV